MNSLNLKHVQSIEFCFLKLTQKGWDTVAPKLARDIDFITGQKKEALRGTVAYCVGGAWLDVANAIKLRLQHGTKLVERKICGLIIISG